MKLAAQLTKAAAATATATFALLVHTSIALANKAAANDDELKIGSHVDNFTGVLTGPFVKLAAVVLVLVAAFLLSRGDEMHQSFKTLGGLALGLAVLLALPTILTAVGVGGFMLPHLTR